MFASFSALIVIGAMCGACEKSATSGRKQFSAVTIHMKCEAMNPDMCSGFYGFSVAADGKFKAGPDANGKTIEGSITPDELKTLTTSVESQLASGEKVTCMEIHTIPGMSEVISATLTDGTEAKLFSLGMPDGRCVLGDYEKAKVMEANVRQLLTKYYPRPFAKN
jgi:hypothetical protein